MTRIQYQVAQLPRKSGGVKYEPVGRTPEAPSKAIYIEQEFLRNLPQPESSSDLETLARGIGGPGGFPRYIWVTVEVAE